MGVAEDARAAQGRVIARSDRASAGALRLWRQMDAGDLDGSWAQVGPRIEEVASAASVANAATVGSLTRRVAAFDGIRGDVLIPGSFGGVDGSGRTLAGLLSGAVVTTKQAIGSGMSIADALVAGGSYLTVALKSALADVERSASMAAAAGSGYVRYVRLVNPGACSRCAILAGSDRFRSDFRRHPACRCSTVPVKGDRVPDGLYGSPADYFASLSPEEQDRVFTKAGAEAIRLGADPVQVVNSRRGAKRSSVSAGVTYSPARLQRTVIGRDQDGTPVMGYVTVEGTTRRGVYGRRAESVGSSTSRGSGRYSTVQRPRLMPESIIELTDDAEMRKVLLRDAGYTRPMIRNTSNNNWIRENRERQAEDRRVADAFYRSKGIRTG